jgi:glycosyltransferase involved in cell wall biosynthesis
LANYSTHKFSVFILTYNSERYLPAILTKIHGVADEILLLDSGSTDTTINIARTFGCIWHTRALDDFKAQRQYALDSCKYDVVFILDSDEIPNDTLINQLKTLKETGFEHAGYTLERHWNVLGKDVRTIYPIVSPDFPLRLIDRRCYDFKTCNRVHEEPRGSGSIGKLAGAVQHITFETEAILQQKLHRYTNIAAQDILDRRKQIGLFKPYFFQPYTSAFAAFFKWYLVKNGWRDGIIGIRLARYAAQYSYLKYKKARIQTI